MSGSIIPNQGHRLHPVPQCFGKDLLLHRGLEIDKTFVLTACPVDLLSSLGDLVIACTKALVTAIDLPAVVAQGRQQIADLGLSDPRDAQRPRHRGTFDYGED
jgi:hypothetical protein